MASSSIYATQTLPLALASSQRGGCAQLEQTAMVMTWHLRRGEALRAMHALARKDDSAGRKHADVNNSEGFFLSVDTES